MLTDYVAMVSLAQIRRDSDLGTAPTILRLFDETDAARPSATSAWDQSFLKALYGTDAGSVVQMSEITLQMKQELVR